MDVFQRVRDLAEDGGQRSDGLARARARLDDAIRDERIRARTRTRRGVAVTLAGVTAGIAVVAGTLLATHLTRPAPPLEAGPGPVGPHPTMSTGPSPTASPETSQMVLASVSRRVLTGAGVVPHTGQYLRIEAVDQELISYDREDGVSDLGVNRVNADAAWVIRSSSVRYVPADPNGEWVYVLNDDRQFVRAYGPEGDSIGRTWFDELARPSSEPWRVRGGNGYNYPDGLGGSMAEFLDRVPDDPAAITEWLEGNVGHGSPQKVGWNLALMLSYNVGSPQKRSAMYQALSALPDSELVRRDGDLATIVFHPSDADVSDGRWHSITIDLSTGIVVEYTDRQSSNPALVPDDVPDVRMTYSVSVVDAAP